MRPAARVVTDLTGIVSSGSAAGQELTQGWAVSPPTPRFPRDLVDEIDAELVAARRVLTWDGARVRALEELLATARSVALDLGRGVEPADLVAAAPTEAERTRRQRLMRTLRAPDSAGQRDENAL
jgi:hypothetical protein